MEVASAFCYYLMLECCAASCCQLPKIALMFKDACFRGEYIFTFLFQKSIGDIEVPHCIQTEIQVIN